MEDWELPAGIGFDDVQAAYGFVYEIFHKKSQRAYLGRKNCWARRAGQWRPSAWKKYWGSCDALSEVIAGEGHDAFTRRIVRLCHSAGELAFAEVEAQVKADVLTSTLADGSPAYWNRNVAGRYWARSVTPSKPWTVPRSRKKNS